MSSRGALPSTGPLVPFELLEDPEADAVYGLFDDSPEPEPDVLEQVRQLAMRPGGTEKRGVGSAATKGGGKAVAGAGGEEKENDAVLLQNAAGALRKKLKRMAREKEEDGGPLLGADGLRLIRPSDAGGGAGKEGAGPRVERHSNEATAPAPGSGGRSRRKTPLELAMESRKQVQKNGKKKGRRR